MKNYPAWPHISLRMKRKLKISVLLLAMAIFSICSTSLAQSKPLPKTISGGIVNGKAKSLPKPDYPDEARLAKAEGEVRVSVMIDETGRVISAKTLSGPENVSLRRAAEAAALKATFSPTLLSGHPVKVSGVTSYKFLAASGNEEKLKVMGVSVFVGIVRHFAADLDKLKAAFEGADLIKEGADEFPEFAQEFTSLTLLEGLTVDKRIEAIDKASSSIRAKLAGSDRWQFEVGQNLAGVMGPLMLIMISGDIANLSKLDEPALRLNLNKIHDLTFSAPADFPQDVLEKLKVFSTAGGKDNLLTPENLDDFGKKMMSLLDTISPN